MTSWGHDKEFLNMMSVMSEDWDPRMAHLHRNILLIL
jgi:hypothetical protein